MATPSLSQARSHYDRQRKIAAAAVLAVRRLFHARQPLPEIVATVAAYQLASATASAGAVAQMADSPTPLTVARAFAGVSSAGFAISEPMIATIDRFVEAPPVPFPDTWWEDAIADFLPAVEQLVASEVADAGRTASQVEFVAREDWQNYVRMLNPPSCARCAILAGRIYRDLDAFDRHPGCDCVMVPVQNWQAAHDAGLISTPEAAFEKGMIGGHRTMEGGSRKFVRGLSRADERAVRDGADLIEVINTGHGISSPRGSTPGITTELFGRRVKATTYGTTRRARWRKANPSRLVRLRPEAIYAIAERDYGGDREQAIRLLRLYGYIR